MSVYIVTLVFRVDAADQSAAHDKVNRVCSAIIGSGETEPNLTIAAVGKVGE